MFQVEVYSIAVCYRMAMEIGQENTNIAICSESQASIKAIMAARTTSRLVPECQILMRQLSLHGRVKLLWVFGHVGIRGNDISDEKDEGRRKDTLQVGSEPIIGVIEQHIKEWMFSRSILTDGDSRKGLKAVTGFQSGPRSRTHQAVAGSEASGWPAD